MLLPRLVLASSLSSLLVVAAPTPAPLLSDATIALVKQQLASHATDSWVGGVQTEALLELDTTLSVFSPTAFPLPSTSSQVSDINAIVAAWAAKRPSGATTLAVEQGGAAGDPASLGTAFLVAAATTSNKASYTAAVEGQLSYLFNDVPKSDTGAISMRPPHEAVQLWADFIYMVPPFLAYYGAVNSDETVLREAYTQIKLVRDVLRDPTTGLWKHIEGGTWQDTGLWGTGSAWAASGMVRVLATMLHSSLASSFTSEISDLAAWTDEVIYAAFSRIGSDNLLPNYFDSSNTFSDTASSALLASAAFRLGQLDQPQHYSNTIVAQLIRGAVNEKIDATTGWVQNVVDPLLWTIEINSSPEAQAFVLLLEAAYRDWL